jgi:hypothetical protein
MKLEVKMRTHCAISTAIGLSLALAFSGAAFAADSSSGTSGPAAGGNVQPGSEAKPATQGNDKPSAAGGGAGVQGQPGNKSGPAAEKPSK